MSFTIPAGFETALLGGTLPLSLALRIVRRDGLVSAFTTAQRAVTLPALTIGSITIPSTTYDNQHNLKPSNLIETDDLRANNCEFRLTTGALLTADDVAKGLYEGAKFSLIIFHRNTLTYQMLRMRGELGDVRATGQEVTFKLRSLASRLQQEIIDLTSPLSRYEWDSPQMAFFNLDGNTDDGYAARVDATVTSVSTQRRKFILSATAGFPAGRFVEGTVEWTSGANDGLIAEVQSWNHSTGEFTLWHPMAYDIAPGDSVRAQIACPLTIEDWRTLFGSARYFGGEPQITTFEKAAEVVGEDEEI